ncbi:LicD [Penicillium cf. griseofulvum]|uniref:LicD n=1 Tax=Penicillium cf. griseofulvum TaxID=2972120 RepID=A0A9W9MT24_9EURO|nr:LicD [Penicillium cf. griseofulvum]KAJ5446435.1 LicD [Penicillium cf. griseofulvum]KAJ5448176.1 LicD [Penicillium cf. griseofulvum]
MRSPVTGVLWLYGLLLATIISGVCGDTQPNFLSVRKNVTKEYKSEREIPTEKYFRQYNSSVNSDLQFHAAYFNHHYDDRYARNSSTPNPIYANSSLPDRKVIPYLSDLVQTYFTIMNAIGAETWIMHGTLLAWWWNQKLFPWDDDLDVQISEATIHFLADYYNMTEHHFDLPNVDGGRTYMLDVNPNYVVKSERDTWNKIDARWIDMSSGLFIDITAVRKDEASRLNGRPEALMCKDKHSYDESDIFPLRDSLFEGVPVKVPYAYTYILEEEYGPLALTRTTFNGYIFNERTKIWESA